jgi:Mor family transcriptional regulator
MVQTLNPRKVYMELGKKYKLDWQHIIRIVKAAKMERSKGELRTPASRG